MALQAEVDRLNQEVKSLKTKCGAQTQTHEVTRRGDTDWTQCGSEGGKKNCAKCSNSDGTLLCDEAHPYKKKPTNRAEACPDNAMASNGAFFVQGRCIHLKNALPATLTGAVMITYQFPGIVGQLMATRILVTHPIQAHQSVGLFVFKRLATHTCTGKRPIFCKKGTKVADVYKVAYCVKCPEARYNTANCKGKAKCTLFPSRYSGHAYTKKKHTITHAERLAFVSQCLPNALHVNGTIKTQYECKGRDAKFAGAVAMSF